MKNNTQGPCLNSNYHANSKGVSMITLVIVIIVVIILAGVAMYSSTHSIDEAALSAFSQELKDVEQMTATVRIGNKINGITEDVINKGFYKTYITNPPEDFECFVDENDPEKRLYGYVVDLSVIDYENTKRGQGYKNFADSADQTVEFGKDDVYIYDSDGKVFYVKGYETDDGLYYTVDDVEGNGPIITNVTKNVSSDKKSVEITVTVKRKNNGDLSCKLGEEEMTKVNSTEDTSTFNITVRENKTYKIYATEAGYGTTSTTVTVTEIDAETFNISYNANAGGNLVSNLPSEDTIKTEKVPTFLSSKVPTREGYTFLGWSTNASATAAMYKAGAEFIVDADTILYAIWGNEIRTFNLTYSANGGKNEPSPVVSVSGEVTISTKTPTYDGFGFDGWSEDAKATSADIRYAPGSKITLNKNLVLYAVWKKDMYTVSAKTAVKMDDGTIKDSESISENPGQVSGTGARALGNKVTLTATANAGYIFDEWKVNTGNISTTGNEETTYFNMPKGDVSVTAVFKRVGVTVRYDANGGNGAPSMVSVKKGEEITISPVVPTRAKYDFLGWGLRNTDKTATYTSGQKYTVNQSVIFYAVWKPTDVVYEIRYDLNGGTANGKDFSTVSRVQGDALRPDGTYSYPTITSNVPYRDGFTFYGWTTVKGSEDVIYVGGNKYDKENSVVLYAIWIDEESPRDLTITPFQSGDDLYLKANAHDEGLFAGYAWNKTNTSPSDFITIDSNDAKGIGTKDIEVTKKITEKGTHYVWFKDVRGNISNISIEVYEITYNNNGGVGGITKQYKALGSVSTVLSEKIPTRAEHVFLGWSTNASPALNDATQVSYRPKDRYSQNSDVILTAVWGESGFTLSATTGTSEIGGSDIVITATKKPHTGDLSAISADSDIATVKVEGNVITISPGTKVGTTTITVKEGTMGVERTITVTINKGDRRITLSEDSKTFTYGDKETTITYNYIGNPSTDTVTTSNADIATARIQGKGIIITPKNVGTATITLQIAEDAQYRAKEVQIPVTVNKKTIIVTPRANQSKVYDGTEATPTLTYDFSGVVTGETAGFNGALTRDAGSNVGQYVIRIGTLSLKDNGTFKVSNYTLSYSSTTVYFSITPQGVTLPSAITGQIFDGNVKYGVAEGALYTRSGNYYATNAGSYVAVVSLNDTLNYMWSDNKTNTQRKINWSIGKLTLTDSKITCQNIPTQTYTGGAITPALTVKMGTVTLAVNTDYVATYTNNVNSGTANVTITGTGNYTGTINKTFTIQNATMSVSASGYTGTYTGTTHSITVTVTKPTSGATIYYSTSPLNSSNYNTTGSTTKPTYKNKTSTTVYYYVVAANYNAYSGSATVTINAKSIASGVTVSNVSNLAYNGAAQTPTPVLTDTNLSNTRLVLNTDYAISYANNKNPGTATITFTGKGNYTGTITKNFTITGDIITISKSTEAPTTTIGITISHTISIGTLQYNINGGAWVNYTGTFNVTSNCTINVRSVHDGVTIGSNSIVISNICSHSFTTRTCTEAKRCTICGYVAETARGHNFVVQDTSGTYLRSSATCTAQGTYYYKCDWCTAHGTNYFSVPALGHNYSNATCTSAQTCTRCGATNGSALGHNYSNATCTSAQTCTRCGATSGSALGHNYSNATCTSAQTCTRCGATSGSALGHSYAAATCTSAQTCTRCGATNGSALGHSYAAATCTSAQTCTRCGAKSGSALGHDYCVKSTTSTYLCSSATCTRAATYYYKCSRCTAKGSSTYANGDALGHSYGSWSTTKSATCTAAGSKRRTCSRCSNVETQSISALGHNYADATCTAPKTCTRCGVTSGSALGHLVLWKSPFYSIDTYQHYTRCKRCNTVVGQAHNSSGSGGKCSVCGTYPS